MLSDDTRLRIRLALLRSYSDCSDAGQAAAIPSMTVCQETSMSVHDAQTISHFGPPVPWTEEIQRECEAYSDSLARALDEQIMAILQSAPVGAIPPMTICQVPAEPCSKLFPHCCGFTMVEVMDRAVFVCVRGGCDRIVTVQAWLNGEAVMPKKAWKPTVPHPLLQIDEELHRP